MITDFTITLDDGGGNKTAFDTIAYVDDNNYSWGVTAVLKRRSDAALFLAEDSGCSCNGFGDHITTADLIPLHRFEDAYPHVDADERRRLDRSRELRDVVYRSWEG